MVVEGIITNIDYSTNICFVRMPVFETVGDASEVIVEGRIAIQPGAYNGYKIGDLVWIGFVDGKLEQPLVLGKVYTTPTNESNVSGGQLNVDGLNVTGTNVTIPKETKISNTGNNLSIEKLINQIKDLELSIAQRDDQIKSLNTKINAITQLFGTIAVDSNGNVICDTDNEILQLSKN